MVLNVGESQSYGIQYIPARIDDIWANTDSRIGHCTFMVHINNRQWDEF